MYIRSVGQSVFNVVYIYDGHTHWPRPPVTHYGCNTCIIISYQQYGGASNTSSNQTIIPITIDSFNGAVLVVKVEKRPGMEKENLLKPDDEEEVKDKETDSDEGDGFMGSMFGRLVVPSAV